MILHVHITIPTEFNKIGIKNNLSTGKPALTQKDLMILKKSLNKQELARFEGKHLFFQSANKNKIDMIDGNKCFSLNKNTISGIDYNQVIY